MKHTEWLGEPGAMELYWGAGTAAMFIAIGNGWRGAFHISMWWEAMDRAVVTATEQAARATERKWADACWSSTPTSGLAK